MNLKTIASLVILIIALSACNDDKNILGGSLLPSKDIVKVSYTDSIPLEAYSYLPDSIRTDAGSLLLLGGYRILENEMVGGAKADIAMEFVKYDIDTLIFKSNYEVTYTSSYLQLLHKGHWGDSLGLNLVEVYELSDYLYNDTFYYSNQQPIDLYNTNNKIGELQFEPVDYTVHDTIRNSEDYVASLKIPLNNAVGERVFNNLNDLDENRLIFRDLFKGVYIKSAVGEKTIMYISPYDEFITSFQVECKTKYDRIKNNVVVEFGRDTTVYAIFACSPEAARLNIFRQIPGTYNFDGGKLQNKLLLKGMAGANIRIALPPLYSQSEFAPLPGDDSARIAINRAIIKLTIDRDLSYLSRYPAPSSIKLRRDTDDGGFIYAPDEALYLAADKDYTYGVRLSDYTYEFNITEYVQELIDKKTEKPDELVLLIANNRYSPTFTFFKGVSASEDPLKLDIVYTRY